VRVLVTTSPGLGHTFATIPLSWALRAAGHEVLFATAGRLDGDLPAVLGAGVQVAEIATREQMERIRAGLRARRQAEADRLGVPLREMVERDQIWFVRNYRKIQSLSKGVARELRAEKPPAFDVFHDNRYEQHWWCWDTWSD